MAVPGYVCWAWIGTVYWSLYEIDYPWLEPLPDWIIVDGPPPLVTPNKYGRFVMQATGEWLWIQDPAPVMVLNGHMTSDDDGTPITSSMLPGNVEARLHTAETTLADQAASMAAAVDAANLARSQAQSAAAGASSTVANAIAALGPMVKVEECTATLGSNGLGSYSFTKGFTATPMLLPMNRFFGSPAQKYEPVFGAASQTSVSLSGKKTVGVLLLNGSPWTDCVSGDVVKFLAIGV
ncbi:hypothetical protein HX867_04150 [Pseudomonas gingeri]|uniref:hypothetical protein n=1 Tax=Pseudomonas gingeri TaxID=117681 RepID=UPI0015A29E6F|nr:hypothetical protein [Pseudomonas gingeri]NVZ61266.1 hypothetical protein [Pseudomonas gingeri]NVZ77162.1 hypothetical protein [Pseudomonas gingeri]